MQTQIKKHISYNSLSIILPLAHRINRKILSTSTPNIIVLELIMQSISLKFKDQRI